MRKTIMIIVAVGLISGCSTRLDYKAKPLPGSETDRAAQLVEQGFYEDWSKRKPSTVVVTDRFILLSNGLISTTTGFTTADRLGTGAIAVGTSETLTRESGERLYFSSMGSPTVHKKNMKNSQYIVVIRASDGRSMKSINARSEVAADRFADAIETLRLAAPK